MITVKETPVVVPENPVEKVTKIKPSEAVRLGRMIAPKHVQNNFWNAEHDGACFLGAMMLGFGYDPSDFDASIAQNAEDINKYSAKFTRAYQAMGIASLVSRFISEYDNSIDPLMAEERFIKLLEAKGL